MLNHQMQEMTVALVQPFYPTNIGYVARVMKNFGLQKLVLVEPKAELKEAMKFASHGSSILEEATILTMKQLFRKYDLIVGTTAIPAKKSSNLARSAITPQDFAERAVQLAAGTCLLLGRDTTGLTRNELDRCDLLIHIPTTTDYETLNVSHALAIILYELSKVKHSTSVKTASKIQRERLVSLATRLARVAGVQHHKIKQLRAGLRKVLGRSLITEREAFLLMGLFRRSASAIQRFVRYA